MLSHLFLVIYLRRRFSSGLTQLALILAVSRVVLWTSLRPTAVRLRLRRDGLDAGAEPRSTSGAKAKAKQQLRAKTATGILRSAQIDALRVLARCDLSFWVVPGDGLPSAEWSPLMPFGHEWGTRLVVSLCGSGWPVRPLAAINLCPRHGYGLATKR